MRWRASVGAAWAAGLMAGAAAWGADLPPHGPLRVVILSDEVNPHGLSDPELTQPGDLTVALGQAGAGLRLDPGPGGVVEIPTNSIEEATALLGLPRSDPGAYDVLVYFAHRIPDNGNDAAGRQAAFVAAVTAFLGAGGGVVSFHHGSYLTAGKEGILDVVGAAASGAVPWDTVDGQNVINVAPDHFVTCSRVVYPAQAAYADPARGVPPDTYPLFNNTPDERYPVFDFVPSAAGNLQVLFASDYSHSGTTHLLGFVHRQPGWSGAVVAYQPGEHQPTALDDPAGPNFQILANALLFAAGALPPDHLPLQVDLGPGGDVELTWWGCGSTFSVERSTDPAAWTGLGSTAAHSWTDSPPPADILYYRVLRP